MNALIEERSPASLRKSYQICPVCEAGCGLSITSRGREVAGIRGDENDIFSQGHICAKGFALKQLDADPDRVRQPLVRRDGVLQPATWAEAFAAIDAALPALRREHGADAVALYLGNPTAHNIGLGLGVPLLMGALRTRNFFTAGTVDQVPKQFACGLMYGDPSTVAVPDIDRCDYLLILGANPIVSNGSLWMVPNFRGRLREMRGRGGRLVVVDPRRSETAEVADQHLFIRPGTDAHFLMAILHVMFRDGVDGLGLLRDHIAGADEIRNLMAQVVPERMSALCGIPLTTIETVARDLARTDKAAVYGRLGTTAQKHGSLTSWLIDVVNIVAGNLDRPGGAMFPKAPAFLPNTKGAPGVGKGFHYDRYRTRVSGRPEVMGEFPIACLAEEIETPGPGQIKALITVAGNPVLSAPNAPRLEAAIQKLEFRLAFDIYLTETTRLADVVLPGSSPLERPSYERFSSCFNTRNVARYSPPVFAAPEGHVSEWESMLQLTAILGGAGVIERSGLAALEDGFLHKMIDEAVGDPYCIAYGQNIETARESVAQHKGVDRVLDIALRCGPYGDGFGKVSGGLCLEKLIANPQGVDFGALAPRIPEILRTPSGKIEIAPEALRVQASALIEEAVMEDSSALLLIGRRQARSNNSWMHNLRVLAKGPFRCTLLIHSEDARRRGIVDGDRVLLRVRTAAIEAVANVTDEMMRGVVSLPHGWGHNLPNTSLTVAQERPGVNSNILTDDVALEALTGTGIINGIPVEIECCPPSAA